jgi:predicted dehydrogenase
MRDAYRKAEGRVVQIGHQSCSSGLMTDALQMLSAEPMGKITAIHMTMYRNTPHGKPQWSRPIFPDVTPENVLWKKFLGEAPDRPFDANRFVNWRFYFDYSGGNVYENMCHQVAFWYKALKLQIPKAVTMNGGIYLWKDGREVPDTMCVNLEQPEEMLITWNSGFGNDHLKSGEDVLGDEGTIVKGQQIRYMPQRVNVKDRGERLGQAVTAPQAHMRNFLDCIRNGGEPNCPFEVGFRVSIASRMAVESYRQARTIKWDPAREELV